jgi:hypothetical protein
MGTPTGQTESTARRVIDHIAEERFTGLLRVRTREADGELWFLAGIQQDARFGSSKGDEAVDRLMRATAPVFDAEQRLPSLTGGFKQRLSPRGSFSEVQPVTLMRYCETYALTCVLQLLAKDRTVRITYRTGELVSLDGGSGGDDTLPALLESDDGTYQFELPPFELPPGVNTVSSAPRAGAAPTNVGLQDVLSAHALPGKPSLAERVDLSLANPNVVETNRRAELGAQAQRNAEAEARRKADAEAEAKRNAEAEAKRNAEAEAKRQAEAMRQAEAKHQAEEETKRRVEAEREAEAGRNTDTAAQGQGMAQPKARSEAAVDAGGSLAEPSAPRPRSSVWVWWILALIAAGLAYFYAEKQP